MSNDSIAQPGNQGSVPPTNPAPFGAPAAPSVITLDLEGLSDALQQKAVQLRLNVRSMVREILIDDVWHELTDYIEANLLEEIQRDFRTEVVRYGKVYVVPAYWPQDRWERALRAYLLTRQVDPFIEWLNALPAWDGTPRLETLLVDTLTVDDTPLARAATVLQLKGALARTFEPGCKHDIMLIISGPQGAGKSSLLIELLPSHDYFSDNVDFTLDTKEMIENAGDSVIIEFDEVRGMTARHLPQIKSFLSRRTDRVRLSYAKYSVTIPRRWVAWGTANDDGTGVLAKDPTGSRRFICLESHNKEGDYGKVVNYLRANREQIWAECLELYQADQSHDLPAHLYQARDNANRDTFRENEILNNAVAQLSDQLKNSGNFTFSDLRQRVVAMVKDGFVFRDNELQHQLTDLGWKKERHGNTRTWVLNEAKLIEDEQEEIVEISDLDF